MFQMSGFIPDLMGCFCVGRRRVLLGDEEYRHGMCLENGVSRRAVSSIKVMSELREYSWDGRVLQKNQPPIQYYHWRVGCWLCTKLWYVGRKSFGFWNSRWSIQQLGHICLNILGIWGLRVAGITMEVWIDNGWISEMWKPFCVASALRAQVTGENTLGSFWRLSWNNRMTDVCCDLVVALMI